MERTKLTLAVELEFTGEVTPKDVVKNVKDAICKQVTTGTIVGESDDAYTLKVTVTELNSCCTEQWNLQEHLRKDSIL
jgi:hypothetical protein